MSQLELDHVHKQAYSMKTAYQVLMNVSDHVREFSPLSTNFIKKDMEKVIYLAIVIWLA